MQQRPPVIDGVQSPTPPPDNAERPATGATLPTQATPGERSIPAWQHALALATIGAATVYVARGMWAWSYDDAYIIYRYAANLARGLGMVYNPGEHYMGTSSAGYTVLLAALNAPTGLGFPLLGSMVSACSVFVCGVLLWLMGVQSRRPLVGLLSALFTVLNPLVLQSWGGEMPLLLALVLGTIFAYCQGRGILTGALLGLAVLTRQDSLVLAVLLLAHYLWVHRRIPWSAVAAFAVVLIPWFAYAWAFFGSPLPGTLQAKIAQGQAGWPLFFSGTLSWLGDRWGAGLSRWAVIALAAVGALALAYDSWRRRPVLPWLLFFGWVVLFSAGYTALRVAFYHWYSVPVAVGAGVLVAWGVGILVSLASEAGRRLAKGKVRPAAGATLGALALVLLLSIPVTRLFEFDQEFTRASKLGYSQLYRQAGDWLKAHTPGSSSVAYLEVGQIGYFSGNRVVDLLGLITPGASEHVPYLDYGWAIERYSPDYYLANPQFETLLQNIASQAWFKAAYSEVATIQGPGVLRIVVYGRKPGTSLPAPLQPVAMQSHAQQAAWLIPGAARTEWPGQTFAVDQPNLAAIDLLVGKNEGVVTGTLVLHLHSSPGDSRDLRTASLPLASVAANSWTTFRFEPLPGSAGKDYYFDVEYQGPTGPPRVALWYATDDLYPGGTRYQESRPAPGDLCFRASVLDTAR